VLEPFGVSKINVEFGGSISRLHSFILQGHVSQTDLRSITGHLNSIFTSIKIIKRGRTAYSEYLGLNR
jgi:hypothetical protein